MLAESWTIIFRSSEDIIVFFHSQVVDNLMLALSFAEHV
jgi:hypothetical protein